jgi:hypothetical protein
LGFTIGGEKISVLYDRDMEGECELLKTEYADEYKAELISFRAQTREIFEPLSIQNRIIGEV